VRSRTLPNRSGARADRLELGELPGTSARIASRTSGCSAMNSSTVMRSASGALARAPDEPSPHVTPRPGVIVRLHHRELADRSARDRYELREGHGNARGGGPRRRIDRPCFARLSSIRMRIRASIPKGHTPPGSKPAAATASSRRAMRVFTPRAALSLPTTPSGRRGTGAWHSARLSRGTGETWRSVQPEHPAAPRPAGMCRASRLEFDRRQPVALQNLSYLLRDHAVASEG